MSMQDPISDMLTRVRNAQMAGKKFVDMPGSVKSGCCESSRDEGYIAGHRVEAGEGKPRLSIELKCFNGKPVIAEIERFSKPRFAVMPVKTVCQAYAVVGRCDCIDFKGVMTDRAAKAQGVGGEVLAQYLLIESGRIDSCHV